MRPTARLAALLAAVAATPASAQIDRREQVKTPGLVLDAGGPTAPVWAMTYTADGKHLLAAGQDKVVFTWPARPDGTLDLANRTTLRWRTWHEARGSIYAMALSPDETLVAVAGYGAIPAEVAVIDRTTGKVVAGFEPPDPSSLGGETVWSLAFAPGGAEVAFGTDHGEVWVWAYRAGKNAARKLGTHGPRKGGTTNRVHRLVYQGAGRLLSVAQDGRAVAWPVAGGPGKDLFRTVVPNANLSAVTPNGRLLAFGGQDDPRANVVEVCQPNGGQPRTAELPPTAVPTAMAFSRDGGMLAVGVQDNPSAAKPHLPPAYKVVVFDVTGRQLVRKHEFVVSNYAAAVTFGPDGNTLAVAGGDDLAVRVVDLDPVKVRQVVGSAGRPIWGVGFSADRSKLGFRTARNLKPDGFNDGAAGDWTVFDLNRRAWDRGNGFRSVAPVEELDGWRVVPVNQRRWQVAAGGRRYDLPLDYTVDALPTCYTFLKPPGGGLRLAVGHLWGVSVFAVAPTGVRRLQVGYGHAGDVTAVAPSPDHSLLLTAGRDQTVSCFSLVPWPHQNELGARFVDNGGRLVVDQVAGGSPAWEAGLTRGDEVDLLRVANRAVDRAGWAAALASPEPNRELFFQLRRPGVDGVLPAKCTVRRRPVWKFFPTADGEWVLWRWRDYFYDSSPNGDAVVGWQVNGPVGDTPEFFRAEQFRRHRRNPDKVREALAAAFVPDKPPMVELLPPKVELTVSDERAGQGAVTATVSIVPSLDGQVHQPSAVSLWVNDHRVATWPGRERFSEQVQIPAEALRTDRPNTVIAQAYGDGGTPSRGDSRVRQIAAGGSGRAAPRMHGLFVGVTDYAAAKGGISNLQFSIDDARAVAQAWRAQAGRDFYQPGLFIELHNGQVSREAVLAEVARIGATATADDLVVVFLSGHGWADLSKAKSVGEFGSDAFAFVTPQFDPARPRQTGLPSEELYSALIAVRGRKLVLLDTCHSGSVQQAEYVRALTPDGVGPAILSACGREELSWEFDDDQHGLFTLVLLDALRDGFDTADRNKDRTLDEGELAGYVARHVPLRLSKLRPNSTQQPQVHPRAAGLVAPVAVARRSR